MIHAFLLSLVALTAPSTSAPDRSAAQGAERTWEILVVDGSGRPVPDVSLEIVDRAASIRRGEPAPERALRSDGEGVIGGADDAPFVLDLVSRDPDWAVAFLYGARVDDGSPGNDILGRPLRPLRFDDRPVCVVRPKGEIRIRVEGARPDDTFHATFADERPEPMSHRPVRASASFRGAEGTLAVAPGRGTLYVARDGAAGAHVLALGRPLLVSVAPKSTTEVALRFVDGPTTTLIAPFDSIPFGRLEALTPDGARVVASLPFDASPLRIPSALPVAAGTPFDPDAPLAVRLPRQVFRAMEPRGGTSFGTLEESKAPELVPEPQPASSALVFTTDIGGKLRFPESELEWLGLARNGLLFLEGAVVTSDDAPARGQAAGVVRLAPDARGGAREPWGATVITATPDGTPLPYREVLVARERALAERALTDATGRLRIEGATGETVVVGSLALPADRVTVTKGPAEAATLVLDLQAQRVSGTWLDADGAAVVGGVLALVPADAGEAAALRPFGTRSYPIAVADREGAFAFAAVAPGEFVLRTDRGAEHALAITRDFDARLRIVEGRTSGAATLRLED